MQTRPGSVPSRAVPSGLRPEAANWAFQVSDKVPASAALRPPRPLPLFAGLFEGDERSLHHPTGRARPSLLGEAALSGTVAQNTKRRVRPLGGAGNTPGRGRGGRSPNGRRRRRPGRPPSSPRPACSFTPRRSRRARQAPAPRASRRAPPPSACSMARVESASSSSSPPPCLLGLHPRFSIPPRRPPTERQLPPRPPAPAGSSGARTCAVCA